jgi:inositol polyphosphate 5-phosphatase INPP5B/F
LRPLDQLNIERREGRVFQGFEEGPLNFVPTYKYQPGTDSFENRPEKKLRAPAWCDRILWLAQEPRHVQQLTYNRSERPNCSDHKPVYSTFRVTVKDVVVERREAIYKELLSLLDRYENQSLPMVGLDRVELDFGQIRYEQSLTLPIQVTNTGNVCAQFRFVPKLDEVRPTGILASDVLRIPCRLHCSRVGPVSVLLLCCLLFTHKIPFHRCLERLM